jgi:hypothetical protein
MTERGGTTGKRKHEDTKATKFTKLWKKIGGFGGGETTWSGKGILRCHLAELTLMPLGDFRRRAGEQRLHGNDWH